MKKEVSIAIPVAQLVDPIVLQSMLGLVNYAAINEIKIVDIGITKGQLIDDARNGLAETFLATNTEWLFWMDSDMTFPKETLVELFKVADEKKTKMVTGVYYQRKGNNFPVLWSRGSETETGQISGMENSRAKTNKYVGSFLFPHPNKKEPFKVHAAGYGCVLIHRSVFEVLDRPWFKFIPGTCSEDFYFFINAQEAGFELWATPTLDLGHIGDAPVITKKDFFMKLEKSNLEIDALKREEIKNEIVK
jgi:hypothetical protein